MRNVKISQWDVLSKDQTFLLLNFIRQRLMLKSSFGLIKDKLLQSPCNFLGNNMLFATAFFWDVFCLTSQSSPQISEILMLFFVFLIPWKNTAFCLFSQQTQFILTKFNFHFQDWDRSSYSQGKTT